MASSSISSIRKSFKYDVLLSFRGKDASKNFVDHLYVALQRQGICVFKGNEGIKKGKDMANEFLKSIEDSKFFIIVFSKNYASSSWYLDEVMKIMEYQKTTEQTAYPIFYDVEASEVRNQTGAVGEAFARVSKKEGAGRWRAALEEAANLAGWEMKNTAEEDEAIFIQRIVEEIWVKLHSVHMSKNEITIGMESRIKEVLSSLEIGHSDVRMIGIEGMAGVGKTTLAKAIFDRISFRYEGMSFVRNVREVSEASLSGLMSLQKQVLSNVLNDEDIAIRGVNEGKSMIKKELTDRKLLVVLDDVDHIDQLEALAGSSNWFGKGSVIIIATRDEQLLLQHGVKQIHHVNELSDDEAVCLFSRYAFGGDIPVAGYRQLSLDVIHCTAGVPSAIKGLGSFLRGRNEAEWIDVLQRLKVISLDKGVKINALKQIRDILKSSNTSLKDDDKELFLDVMKYQQNDELVNLDTLELILPSMASSSTSSIRKSFKYDVFLSFKGEDTCTNFVHHLYHALQEHSIYTYKDDRRIEEGRKIDNEVIRSIQESRFLIVVISRNYVSSSWCLDELVTILQCHDKVAARTVYPVFYDVEPSDVRKQSGAVGEAFAKHSKDGAAEKWRCALRAAAFVSGWELKNTADGHEARLINEIVEEIALDLRSMNVYNNSTTVGMETRIKDVLSHLHTDSGDVHLIGIMGMGGVGKTTLSRAIFVELSSHFEGRSFVENVREVSKASLSGLQSLQKQVLSDVLNDEGITISSVNAGINMIKKELGDRKVLVVLDDVDHIEQLEALAGAPHWFKKGSIIIITTRDEEVLRAHATLIYRVSLLSDEEAICLLSWYAFGREIPAQEYKELSHEVVRYTGGHPLTIKILGSFLCGKGKQEWMNVLRSLREISLEESLKEISLKQTLDILELSYLSLGDVERDIFLDVACFMKGLRQNDALRILESCGFPGNGLKKLERKSLLTISNERLGMHDYIEEMGRNIVRRTHPNQPNQHTRLWMREEIEDILARDLGTEATRRVQLSELQLSPQIVMEGFGSMKKLRCLIVESENENGNLSSDWEFNEVRQYLPDALRYLRWVDYPVRSLPGTFQANNLVALEMPGSKITQLWKGGERKVLNNLRFLDLSYSTVEALNLGLTPNLEWLDLKGCHDLEELHTPVGCLKRLDHLNLVGCSRFKSLLYINYLESLGVLSLSKLHLIAKSLQEFPRYAIDNLPNLQFTCNYLEEQPSAIRNGHKSVSINIPPCTKLESVSGSICGLQHLRHLTLDGCIPEVPKDLDQLTYLEKLNLVSTRIKCLPDSICRLKHLKGLKLRSCELLEKLPEGLGRLQSLEKLTLSSTRINHLPDSLCMLKHLKSLKLESCWLLEKLPDDLGRLESLEKLILKHCASLGDIPNSICNMKHLRCFRLPFCNQVEKLPEELGSVERLEELNINSTGISHLPQSISLLKGLRIVGSVEVLQSCVCATEIQTSETETFCYIQAVNYTPAPTELRSQFTENYHRRWWWWWVVLPLLLLVVMQVLVLVQVRV